MMTTRNASATGMRATAGNGLQMAAAGRFEPVFPGYAARVRESFAKQGAMALIGAALDGVEPGWCAISLAPHAGICQQHGYVHGGIVATIADSAGGYAGLTLFSEENSVLTVEFKLNLLAPAVGDRLVAEGIVVKAGRTLAITRGEIHAERTGVRTLVAIMQQTLMVIRGRSAITRSPRDASGAGSHSPASEGSR